MKKSIILPLLIVAIAGCHDKPKNAISPITGTDSLLVSTGKSSTGSITGTTYIDSSRIIVDNFKAYTEAWLKFQDVAREEQLNKALFNETHDNKWADKYNNLLPKYHRLGHKMDSLYKLNH